MLKPEQRPRRNPDPGTQERTLNEHVPELKPYLRPGARVLDIGCGAGAIALDVANAVKPGDVVGIDVMQDRIDMAHELSRERKISNAVFQLGDTYNLAFADDTFDVVCSHTTLHSLIDPVKALQEQRRVTIRGGWVLASGIRDYDTSARYPPCPMLAKVYDAWVRYHAALSERYQNGDKVPGPDNRRHASFYYLDLYAGRKCVEWFSKAGLVDLKVQVRVFSVVYPGSEDVNPLHAELISPEWEAVSEVHKDMFAEGFLDSETLEEARREVAAWYTHPHAFHYWAFVCAAGRA